MKKENTITLPDLNCGVCGYRTCREFAESLERDPSMIKRCIHLSSATLASASASSPDATSCCGKSPSQCGASEFAGTSPTEEWKDHLGREFDFYLDHFPEEPGPREIVLPHNPMITREMDMKRGDIMIGRPLGMSCGCPITHCGVVMDVDSRTGVMNWCVTGPLDPRQKGFKDIGYYSAEGYEGLVAKSRPGIEIKIGMRYYFQPRMCMLQWRHSGLVNYINKTDQGLQIRLEGLWIG